MITIDDMDFIRMDGMGPCDKVTLPRSVSTSRTTPSTAALVLTDTLYLARLVIMVTAREGLRRNHKQRQHQENTSDRRSHAPYLA